MRGEQALREQRRLTEERHRFLASASEALLSSLELAPALEGVADLSVQSTADWCFLEINDDDGRAGISPAVQARRSRARSGGGGAPAAGHLPASTGARRSCGTTPPSWSPPWRRASCRNGRVDPALAELLNRAGCRSFVRVPISLANQAAGSLAFFSGRAGCYLPEDLEMARDLAHRIAFACDNARLYREARRAITLREEFLSIASHELRTPLTPLLLHFQKLLHPERRPEATSPDKLRETLAKCERQLQRLAKLVDSLLDVSRISAGALNLNLDQVDLAEIVREVLSRFAEESARANCPLEVHADEPVVGHWDRIRVEQLVTNLVANALKYGRGKPVAVTVERRAGAALLTVRDHGIGIDPEKLPRIFERFERAASPTYGGLGLGLYIARQIVSAHGGEIG